MPGIVVFKRRWSVGSDDLVVPAIFGVILHSVWIVVLGVILGVFHSPTESVCADTLREHVLGYIVIMSGCLLVEGCIAWVSMRGTILNPSPRSSMQYLLYVRLGVFIVEVVWLVIGVVWIVRNFSKCDATAPKRAVLGVVVCNWIILFSLIISLWCTFDTAGKSWVKMKRYQESMKEKEPRPGHKRRSGSGRRNWRHRYHTQFSVERVTRKAMRKYEKSWDRRCKFMFCCVKEDRHRSSFTEVARLFTEFFRDLDVVPSDVVAGLMLLRRQQQTQRKFIVNQGSNEVYQFLSGVPISPATKFLSMKNPDVLAEYKKVVHYMRYALAAYGWPVYMMMKTGTGLCRIMPRLRCCFCCCCSCFRKGPHAELVEDNCCQCNFAALRTLGHLKRVDVVYCTYHVDIGETPFYITLDHEQKTVVISIRGTLSLQDVLTDLKAEPETIPVDPIKEDWLGHKGMVQAAVYIKKKIKEEMLLSKAFGRDVEHGIQDYELVLVGHSLGAGTAAILAILLRQEYPNLHCYAFSPPGGLISATCVEETKSFITSVVVGKDVVPRIGLYQLESLRQDLINVIKKSADPKWKIIGGSVLCCCCSPSSTPQEEQDPALAEIYETNLREKESRYFLHPTDSQIALTQHIPLYPPGKIIHVVRSHPKSKGLKNKTSKKAADVEYKALLADNLCFKNEVIVSPTMLADHMAINVMEALEAVLTNVSPAKPSRKFTETERKAMLTRNKYSNDPQAEVCEPIIVENRVYLESSFNDNNITEPGQLDSFDQSGVAFSIPPEGMAPDNTMSWSYTQPPPVSSNSKNGGESSRMLLRPKSYPPKPRPHFRLDFYQQQNEWTSAVAPLATPETLSEASSFNSLSSRGSRKLSSQIGYQRLSSDASALETIQQSPERTMRSDSFGDPRTQLQNFLDSNQRNERYLPNRPKNGPLTVQIPHNGLTFSNECVENGIPSRCHLLGIDTGSYGSSNGISSRCGLSPIKDVEVDHHNTAEKRLSQNSSQDSRASSPDYENVPDMFDDTDKSCSLNFEEEIKKRADQQDLCNYVKHSPDSTNQVLYDLHNHGYSHAGRGYPHGGFVNGLQHKYPIIIKTEDMDKHFSPQRAENSSQGFPTDNCGSTTNGSESLSSLNKQDDASLQLEDHKYANGDVESSPDYDSGRKDFHLHIDEEQLITDRETSYLPSIGNKNNKDCLVALSPTSEEVSFSTFGGGCSSNNNVEGSNNNNCVPDSPCHDNLSLSDSEPFMMQPIDSDSQSASPNNLYSLIHSGLFVQESEV